MKNLLKSIGITAIFAVVLFNFTACREDGGGSGSGGRTVLEGVWEAQDGRRITISGNTITIILPGEGHTIDNLDIRGNFSLTSDTINININRYSLDNGNTWLTRIQFIDARVLSLTGTPQSEWSAMTEAQRQVIRNQLVGSLIPEPPTTRTLTYQHFSDLNQLFITEGTTNTLYQREGTRTVPQELIGRWVYGNAPDVILLEFTNNQLIRRLPPGGTDEITFFVKETDGLIEIGTNPGDFTQTFSEAFNINASGLLTFTGGQSGQWYPGGSFIRHIFPPAGVNITPLTQDIWTDGIIPAAGGQQWFSFTATGTAQRIHVNFGGLSDLFIQVFAEDGTTIGAETNLWSITRNIQRTLIAGQTYYIRIRPSGWSSGGTFNITFNTSATPPAFTWTPPDNAAVLTDGQWSAGSIPDVWGVTWYQFQVTAGNTYRIWWNDRGQGNNVKTQDVSVTAFNADGGILTNFSNVPSAWTSPRSFSVTADGTIYLQVVATAAAGGTFGIVFTENNTARPDAPFTAPPSPTLLTVDQWRNGEITASCGGAAWFSLPVTNGTPYRIWWNEAGIASGDGTKTLDVSVNAFYSDGTIALGLQTNAWGIERTFTANRNGTVYFRVIPAAADNTGTFAIIASSSFTARPGQIPTSGVIPLTENRWTHGDNTNAEHGIVWYSFPVASGTYRIWWNEAGTTNGDGTKTLDVTVAGFFSNGGQAILSNTTGWTTPRSVNVTAPDTIYLRVSPASPASRGTFALVYSSTLTARPAEIPTTGVIELTENEWTDGEITSINQIKWYSFPVTNGTYSIWWNEREPNGNTMKSLSISVIGYFSDGRHAFSSHWTGAWGAPQTVNVTADDTIYLRVVAQNSAHTGTFAITYASGSGAQRPAAPITPPTTAIGLTAGEWTAGEMTAASNGEIWYWFDAVPSTRYHIWLNESGIDGNGTKTLNAAVSAFYASSGDTALPIRNNAWAFSQNFDAETGGRIYVRITPQSGATVNSTGTFGITFTTTNTRPAAPINIPTAIPLTEGVWTAGEITLAGQEIWFSLGVTRGHTYRFWWNESDPNGNGLKTLDIDVFAYYASTGINVFPNNPQSIAWANFQTGAPSALNSASTDTIYLRVVARNSTATGTFAIVYARSTIRPAAPFDPPNVTDLTLGQWTGGNIPTAGGVQWFRFTANAATQHIHFNWGTLDDIRVLVFSAAGDRVGQEDSLSGNIPTLNRQLTVDQVYYIRVRPRLDTRHGDFQIVVNDSVTAPAP